MEGFKIYDPKGEKIEHNSFLVYPVRKGSDHKVNFALVDFVVEHENAVIVKATVAIRKYTSVGYVYTLGKVTLEAIERLIVIHPHQIDINQHIRPDLAFLLKEYYARKHRFFQSVNL